MKRLLISLLSSLPLFAQSTLDGDWVIVVSNFDANEYHRLTLHQQGSEITGTAGPNKITGTINGTAITLEMKNDRGPHASATGTLANGEITGQGKFLGDDSKFRLYRPATRPANAPKHQKFEPTEFHRYFSGAIKPALHLYPGDSVETWSVDAGGYDPKGVRRSLGGNPETGPFYIEGALPGDTLAVKFTRIRLNRDTAISSGRISGNALNPGYLANLKHPENYNSNWKLDREKMIGRLEKPSDKLKDYTVALRPMLGCVGVAPPGKMVYLSGFLGPFGGNMDYNKIREGITVYLPVFEPGALLFMGDGHAAQGDGELTGNALETSMDIEFTVDLIRDKQTPGPRAEDDEYLMAMGIAGSLNEALQQSTTNLARWIEQEYGLNPSEVASVLGTSMVYEIAEVVDPSVNMVAKIRKASIATLRHVP
jgi:acetamidase/formamidase